jgi:hypothetical protein
MASFVTLIGVDNNEQVVNVDLITRMVRHDTGEGFTEIYFDQGNDVRVREGFRREGRDNDGFFLHFLPRSPIRSSNGFRVWVVANVPRWREVQSRGFQSRPSRCGYGILAVPTGFRASRYQRKSGSSPQEDEANRLQEPRGSAGSAFPFAPRTRRRIW